MAGVWLAEISADLREAVAHQRRVRDDALYKWPRLLLLYFHNKTIKYIYLNLQIMM